MRVVWRLRVDQLDQLLAFKKKENSYHKKYYLFAMLKNNIASLLTEPSTVKQHAVGNIE